MFVSSVAAACIHPRSCAAFFDADCLILSNSHTLQTQFNGFAKHDRSLSSAGTIGDHTRPQDQQGKLCDVFCLHDICYPFRFYRIDLMTSLLYNRRCKILVKIRRNILRLLIVEDEKELCDTIAKSLYAAGYEVDTCYNGDDALDYVLVEDYDLIVLDLNLPGRDGMDILRELRQTNDETKVIILSARSQIADKVEGLDAGANDYMEKPFHLQELEARIRSLTRRKFVQKDVCLHCGAIRFDTKEREAYAKETLLALTRKESGILEYLLLNQGRPVSQEELIEHVWDASVDSFSGSVRVHMSSLRKKLKAVLGYDPILNKVGEGYKLVEGV